jgi:uncharacterized protein YceK
MKGVSMKKYLLLWVMILFAVSVLSTGCCTVIKKAEQTVTFDSVPDGAQVLIDGRPMGTTPLSVSLKKNAYDTVMIKKSGYVTQTKPLEKKYDGFALLNIFWDFSTTDLITGAAYEYQPNQYYFELKKQEEQ